MCLPTSLPLADWIEFKADPISGLRLHRQMLNGIDGAVQKLKLHQVGIQCQRLPPSTLVLPYGISNTVLHAFIKKEAVVA